MRELKDHELPAGGAVVSLHCASKSFYRPARAEVRSLFRRVFLQKKEKVKAVHNISFEITKGEIVGLLGPNGAGKSTILKLIMGIYRPSSGTTRVFGKRPTENRNQICRLMGIMFGQRSHLISSLPAEQSLNYLARMYDLDAKTANTRIRELSERFETASYLHAPVNKLSLGERTRYELIATLLHYPKLVILDEPTLGLDVSAKIRFRKLLQDMATQEGMTVLMTSHDVGDLDICKRVLLINQGSLVSDTTLAELRKADETCTLSANFRTAIKTALIQQLEQSHRAAYIKVSADGSSISIVTKLDAMTDILKEVVSWSSLATLDIEQESLETILGRIYQQIEGREN